MTTAHNPHKPFCFNSEIKKVVLDTWYEVPFELIEKFWSHGWTVIVNSFDFSRKHYSYALSQIGECCYIGNDEYDKFEDNEPGIMFSVLSSDSGQYQWQEDETALVLFTSDSTGAPQGVCHSYQNIIRSTEMFVRHFQITREDKVFSTLHQPSITGFRTIMLPSSTGCAIKIDERNARFEETLLEVVEFEPTYIICTPQFVTDIAENRDRLKTLKSAKAILCTGDILDEGIRKTATELLGIPVVIFYGLTETAGIVLSETVAAQTPNELPSPCEGTQMRLELISGPDEAYELVIESPNLFLGYLGNPDSFVMRDKFSTGDAVTRTIEGTLKYSGRISRSIRINENQYIFPQLLEEFLLKKGSFDNVYVEGCDSPFADRFKVKYTPKKNCRINGIELSYEINTALGHEYIPRQFVQTELTPPGQTMPTTHYIT